MSHLKTKTLYILSLVLLLTSYLHAQDRVWLLDGRDIACKITMYNDTSTVIEKIVRKKEKEYLIDNEDIFSFVFGDTAEVVIYKPDASKERTFSVEQMRMYVNGAAHAHKHYSSVLTTGGGFVAGAGGPFFLGFYGLAIPVAYDLIVGVIPNFPKLKNLENPELIRNEYFVLGYQSVAHKKKIRNLIISSVTGFVAVGTYSFINFLKN